MISPESFIKLLGAEYDLMRDAGVLKRFYLSSILIVVIASLTWISVEYAMDLLFHSIAVEITLAIFFCLLFFCIYIFLLNTFSKENRVRNGILNASNVIRLGFIAFIGFLIAQPLIVLLYEGPLSLSVEKYKQELLQSHADKIDVLVKNELASLNARLIYYMDQKKSSGTNAYDEDIDRIGSKMSVMQDKANFLQFAATRTIDHSSFFLYRVEMVGRTYPLSWLLTLFIMLLFLLPGYLVYTISSRDEYYRLKKEQEKALVLHAYGFFTSHYKRLFKDKVPIFSRYEDPPFNKVRKQPVVPSSMTEFLRKYLDNR